MGTQDPLTAALRGPILYSSPAIHSWGWRWGRLPLQVATALLPVGGFTQAPLQSPLLHNPSPDTPSPAELARVIHVWACLDVAFFWVVDGGGSGVSSSQDEHKAVEGDSWCILVVCEDGRTGGQGQWSWPPSALFFSNAPNDCPGDRLGTSSRRSLGWLALF